MMDGLTNERMHGRTYGRTGGLSELYTYNETLSNFVNVSPCFTLPLSGRDGEHILIIIIDAFHHAILYLIVPRYETLHSAYLDIIHVVLTPGHKILVLLLREISC